MNPIHIYAPGASNITYDPSHYVWRTYYPAGNIGCNGGGGCSRCKFDYSSDGCSSIQTYLYHLLKPASGFITITYDDIVANYPEAFL